MRLLLFDEVKGAKHEKTTKTVHFYGFCTVFCRLCKGHGNLSGNNADGACTGNRKPAGGSPDKETEVLPLVVYVCGEVVNPGVYELTSGMRICDAVDAAGGLTKKASRDYWNLAEELTDGQMLYFPTAEEAEKRKESVAETAADTGGTADGKVNINTADISQLLTVPGIGQTRAEAVLAYRQEHGSFQCIEDIMKVSGIKNGLFEKMKDYITVG